MRSIICNWLNRLTRDKKASVSVTFATFLIPMSLMAGAGVDYSRMLNAQAKLQAALDSATLTGSARPASTRDAVATSTFGAGVEALEGSWSASFATSGTVYTGTATGQLPTSLMKIAGLSAMNISVTSTVAIGGTDNSCVWTFGSGKSTSSTSMIFNGAPAINLSGCGLRSNTSMVCNGHNTNAAYSIAGGSSAGCPAPRASASLADPYVGLASAIPRLCGALSGPVTWGTASVPTSADVKIVNRGSYTEYHVCGDLTLSGSGTQAGTSTLADTLIIVENGSITLASDAAITSPRTTFVLTGAFGGSDPISFPKGNGHSASWSITPMTSLSASFHGVAVYLPSSVGTVAMNWGPGATFNADGVVYLPSADLTISGNAASGSYGCTLLVTDSLTTNGTVAMNLSQSANGCALASVSLPYSSPRLIE